MNAILGLLIFLLISFLLSENKKKIPYKLVSIALISQFLMCFLVFKIEGIKDIFLSISSFVKILEDSSSYGAKFIFGYLSGADFPSLVESESSNFIIAFRVMPVIIFISALSSLLFHLGILPFIIKILGIFLNKTLKTNAALSFGVCSSCFSGTIEAPLTIKDYLSKFSKSDI